MPRRITDSDIVSPEQTTLWGFCLVAALEYPQVWGGLADLSSTGADDWAELIRRVIAAAPGEDQIALREHRVHVPRLVRRTGQPNPRPLELHSDATYLVTGGLGSLGLEIAGYLAGHGARQLVLTSRRAPAEAAQRRIDVLREQTGCDVRVVAADVANPHDVARLLSSVQAELPPLAGIVHAAGENSTAPLNSLDNTEVDRVFSGKVWGAWYLSEAIADEPGLLPDHLLDLLGVGSFGQSAYSAANAFLDGLTWRLRTGGLPAVSVNFGPWSAGMADEQARAQLDRRGVRTLSLADALAGMADVMVSAGAGTPEAVVARVDWARFLPIYFQAGRRALLVAREVPESVSSVADSSGSTRLVAELTTRLRSSSARNSSWNTCVTPWRR